MKKTTILPLVTIDPDWKTRLQAAFHGIFTIAELHQGKHVLLHARSSDSRTLIEILESNGTLVRGSLQMALPPPEDLEMLKLGCWTLLFLKSLFPAWTELEGWVKSAAEWSTDTGEPIEKVHHSHRVLCSYDRLPNVLDFQVVKQEAGYQDNKG